MPPAPDRRVYTLSELIALADSVGVSEDLARSTFDRWNKNADAWIFVQDRPCDDPDAFNFIDNQAVGHTRP